MNKINNLIISIILLISAFSLLACSGGQPPVSVDSLSFAYTNVSVVVGGELELVPIIRPIGANEEVFWSSSNTDIATVKNGIVSGFSEGEVTISARTDGGVIAYVSVNVFNPEWSDDEEIGDIAVDVVVEGVLVETLYTGYDQDYKIQPPARPDDIVINKDSSFYFQGWYLDEEYTKPLTNESVFEQNSAIYAKLVDVNPNLFGYTLRGNVAEIDFCASTDVETLVVPAYIDGYPVESVANSTFSEEFSYIRAKNLVFSEGVKNIGTLDDLSKLENIYLPSSVEKFGRILKNSALKNIQVDENNEHFMSIDGVLFSKDGTELVKYPTAKPGDSYIIPESVATILKYAFNFPYKEGVSYDLKTLVVSANVKKFETSAFVDKSEENGFENLFIENWKSWCEIDFETSGHPLTYAENIYVDGQKMLDVVIPSTVSEIKPYAFVNVKLNSITLPDTITKIGYMSFYRSEINTVTLGDGLSEIGNEAFYEAKIVNINLEDCTNLSIVGNYAFKNCRNFKKITFPANLTTIGDSAFSGISVEDKIIFIPQSVISMGNGAFSGANNLKICCDYAQKPVGWSENWLSTGTISTMNIAYWYSETKPSGGNYWHYDFDGEILIWGEGLEL